MENNIREFTCNECQEVTKVDWSKVRPDIDDGTSNIYIEPYGDSYRYVGQCDNCGNFVEIEPPVPELKVDNVDVRKDGISVQITDTVTNRSCWIDAWKANDVDDWDWEFNQYIFHLDNDNDIVAKMFQEDLLNYASEELADLVLGTVYEHEEEYNKLQESKAPTMRDRLKEAKARKLEAVNNKLKEIVFDLFDSYEDVEDIIDSLRSLNSIGEITSDEYDEIMDVYDELLNEWENKDKKVEAKYSDGYIDDLPQEYPEEIRNKYYEYVSDIDLVDDEPLDFINWVSKEYPDVYNEIEKEAVYKAVAYYDEKLRGVEDEISSSDWSNITDFAHDKLMKGSYVKITNTTTGKEKVISPDTYQDEFDGEFVVAIEELDESVDDKSQEETLDEAINRAHQEEIDAINTYDTILSKTDETTDAKLVEMIEEIKADEEDHKLLLQHYIETGEALTDDELEGLKNSSSDTDKEMKEEAKDDPNRYCALCGKEKEDYEASMCDDCWEKEKARLSKSEYNNNYNKGYEYLENIAKEDNITEYEIVEDTYEYENGLCLIEYEDKDRKDEIRHICIDLDNLQDVITESKCIKEASSDVVEYFGMQDNTDEKFKSNVEKEYTKLRSKYPDKDMILNGDFGTYLGTEKATPIEKGKYITVYDKVEEHLNKKIESKSETEAVTKTEYKVVLHCYDDEKPYDDEITGTFDNKQDAVQRMKSAAIDELSGLQEDIGDEEFTDQYRLGTKGDKVIIYKGSDILTEYEVVEVNTEMQKTSELSDIEIIENLEGGELIITDVADWDRVITIANDLSRSQGFYGRLLRNMKEAEEDYGGKENLPFPITM